MFYARQGGPAAVAPYAADPGNLHDWQAEQKRHRARLAAVPKLTDQSEPHSLVDTSLHRGRERARVFRERERHREVGQENRNLMKRLHDIAEHKCVTLRKVETDPWLPRVPVSSNKDFYRKLEKKALNAENERIVKRLLKIRTTFDRKGDERQFQRHKQAVQDMKKVPGPPQCPQRERKPFHLPQLQDIPRDATFSAIGRNSPRHADAMPQGVPSMRSAASRSMPNLAAKSMQRQVQDAPQAHPKQTLASSESSKARKRHAGAGVKVMKAAPMPVQQQAGSDVVPKPAKQGSANGEATEPHFAETARDGPDPKSPEHYDTKPDVLITPPEGKEVGYVALESKQVDDMRSSKGDWKSKCSGTSPASSLLRSPPEVLSPDGPSGSMSAMPSDSAIRDNATSEVTAEVVGTVSSTWYTSQSAQSAWTVRTGGDDDLLDSGYENLGINEPRALPSEEESSLNPTELWPSWLPSDTEGEEQADEQKEQAAQQKEPAAEQKEQVVEQEELAAEQKRTTADQEEPAAEHEEPAVEEEEFAVEGEEPAAEHEELAAKQKEHAAEQKETAADQEEPAVAHEDPAVEEEELAVEGEEPAADHEELAAKQEEPAAEQEGLAAEHEDTAVEKKEPVAEQGKLAVGQREPAVEEKEPVAEQEEPVVEEKELAAEQQELVAEHREPATEQEGLAAEQTEPVAEKANLDLDQEERVIEQEEPVVEQEEPVAEKEEPVAEQEKPVVVEGETATEQTEPAPEQAEPAPEQEEPVAEQKELSEPVAEQEEPAVEQKELAVEQKELAVKEEEPAAEHEELAAEQEEPAVEQEELIAKQEELVAEHRQPAVNQRELPVEQEKPVAEQASSVVEQEELVVEQEKQADDEADVKADLE